MKIITKKFDESNIIKDKNNDNIISGYGVIFNKSDHVNDIIHPDAFKYLPQAMKNAFDDRKTALPKVFLPMCCDHDLEKKIGIWINAKIDEYGIFFTGKVDQRYINVMKKIKNKEINSLSISFTLQEYKYIKSNGVKYRLITKCKAVELSILYKGVPCQPEASLH